MKNTEIKINAQAAAQHPLYNAANINEMTADIERETFYITICKSLKTKCAKRCVENAIKNRDYAIQFIHRAAEVIHKDFRDLAAVNTCIFAIVTAKKVGEDVARKLRRKALDKTGFVYAVLYDEIKYTTQPRFVRPKVDDFTDKTYFVPCTPDHEDAVAVDEYPAMRMTRKLSTILAELKAKSDEQARRLADIDARIDALNAEIDEFEKANAEFDLQAAADIPAPTAKSLSGLHHSEQIISELFDDYFIDTTAIMNSILDEYILQQRLTLARERLSRKYQVANDVQEESRLLRNRVDDIHSFLDDYYDAAARLKNNMDDADGLAKQTLFTDMVGKRMALRRALIAIIDVLDTHSLT